MFGRPNDLAPQTWQSTRQWKQQKKPNPNKQVVHTRKFQESTNTYPWGTIILSQVSKEQTSPPLIRPFHMFVKYREPKKEPIKEPELIKYETGNWRNSNNEIVFKEIEDVAGDGSFHTYQPVPPTLNKPPIYCIVDHNFEIKYTFKTFEQLFPDERDRVIQWSQPCQLFVFSTKHVVIWNLQDVSNVPDPTIIEFDHKEEQIRFATCKFETLPKNRFAVGFNLPFIPIQIWDIETKSMSFELKLDSNENNCLAMKTLRDLSNNGYGYLLVSYKNGTVLKWNLQTRLVESKVISNNVPPPLDQPPQVQPYQKTTQKNKLNEIVNNLTGPNDPPTPQQLVDRKQLDESFSNPSTTMTHNLFQNHQVVEIYELDSGLLMFRLTRDHPFLTMDSGITYVYDPNQLIILQAISTSSQFVELDQFVLFLNPKLFETKPTIIQVWNKATMQFETSISKLYEYKKQNNVQEYICAIGSNQIVFGSNRENDLIGYDVFEKKTFFDTNKQNIEHVFGCFYTKKDNRLFLDCLKEWIWIDDLRWIVADYLC